MTHRIAHSLAFSHSMARKRAAWWVYPDSSNSASVIRDTRLASSSQD
jgi:hypothetical protein